MSMSTPLHRSPWLLAAGFGLLVLGGHLLPAAAAPAEAPAPLRRFALVVGANQGGPTRVPLRYAVSDARSFSRVLEELGGVAPPDRLLLVEPDRAGLLGGLAEVGRRLLAEQARRPVSRTEVVFYYSGHSDEQGLLLGTQRLDYPELRQALEAVPAQVRIAVLDSCASGALTRRKGGVHRPPFLVDASTQVQGHAILTSSSAREVAQESDRIGGSFFTHSLVSGLRGAADTSQDGRVTLNEAYEFAFHETLLRTEQTQAGAQHPAYDIQLQGSGDLVVTDLRGTTAGFVVAEPLQGRLYLRDDQGRLVVELHKPAGRVVELGVEPGHYTVTLEQQGRLSVAPLVLSGATRPLLAAADFSPLAGELTARRGASPPEATLAAASPLAETRFALTVVPGFGTSPAPRQTRVTGLAFNLLVGRYAALSGLEVGGIANWQEGPASGAQLAGLANLVGGGVTGLQVAGVVDAASEAVDGAQVAGVLAHAGDRARGVQVAGGIASAGGDLRGAQVAGGANLGRGHVTGVQVSGGLNRAAGPARGLQLAGGANFAQGALQGVQVAGGVNVARDAVQGVQLAGGANLGLSSLQGLQLGSFNLAGDLVGVQIGAVNVAQGSVRGLQLGVVNVADSLRGAPLGVVNWIGDGLHDLALWGDELGMLHLGFQSGSRTVYTLLGASFRPSTADEPLRWGFEAGLGGHFPLGPLFGEVDLSALNLLDEESFHADLLALARLRFTLGWQVRPHLGLFGGVAANLAVSEQPLEADLAWTPRWSWSPDGARLSCWPGFFVGLRV